VTGFATRYRPFIKRNRLAAQCGFDLKKLAALEPLLRVLYENWWRVQFTGLQRLPARGSALIVGNYSGLIPWTALMLIYALMGNDQNARRVNVMADLDWIADERMHSYLRQIGFVPWSSANMKKLFAAGELVAIFPEGLPATAKPFAERNRVREFDWTKFLPAIEEAVEIFPLATYGCDQSVPNFFNFDKLSKFLSMPAFPVSPFFPWLPFPINLATVPVKWSMVLKKSTEYEPHSNRDDLEDTAKRHARFLEGEIQAELNRIHRTKVKSYI